MKLWLIGLASLTLTACSQQTVYVVVPKDKIGLVADDMASFARSEGMKPALGQATSDEKVTVRVVEVKSASINVWGQNMPVSQNEVACRAAKGGTDPAQFIIFIEAWPWVSQKRREKFETQLRGYFTARGYSTSVFPPDCRALCDKLVN